MQSRSPALTPAAELSFEQAARLLKAMSHPLRLRLICGLSREPRNLTRISAVWGGSISTLSAQLGVLRRAGILKEQRSGTEVCFRMDDARVRGVLDALCGGDAGSLPHDWTWESLAGRAAENQPLPRSSRRGAPAATRPRGTGRGRRREHPASGDLGQGGK